MLWPPSWAHREGNPTLHRGLGAGREHERGDQDHADRSWGFMHSAMMHEGGGFRMDGCQ